MKCSNLSLTVVLCLGLAAGFAAPGCGGDDEGSICQSACEKNLACGDNETIEACVAGCEAGTQEVRDCVANNCSTDLDCNAWWNCLGNCGV